MKTIFPHFCAFENEMIVVDQNDIPVNFIDKKHTSQAILDLLKLTKYKKYVKNKSISPELDACQIEIKNSQPHRSLSDAKDEIHHLFHAVEQSVQRDFGLRILQGVVPERNYQPITSGSEKHYQMIHNKLVSFGLETRQNTNIAGLHLHVSTPIIDTTTLYRIISGGYTDLLEKDGFEAVNLSVDRHQRYVDVVKAIYGTDEIMPRHFHSQIEAKNYLFDEVGNVKSSHNYIRAKQFGNGSKSIEVRLSDAGYNTQDLDEKMKHIYTTTIGFVEGFGE